MRTFNPKTFVSGNINDYGEEGRRDFCMTLMDIYVPSSVGDNHFYAICQGRADGALENKQFFSTCGELAMFQLHQLGYSGPILNRTIYDKDGKVTIKKYQYGKNMTRLFSTAKKESNFLHFKGGNTPNPGDICFLSNGPPRTEHVFIFKRQYVKDGKLYWESYDAGQTFGGKSYNQCSKIVARKVSGKKVGGRICHGWVSIATLPIKELASLVAKGTQL